MARTTWKLNVRFFICIVAIVAVGSASTYFWRSYQLRRNAAAYLQRAEEQIAEDDLKSAARNLHNYLKLVPEDVEVRAQLADVFDRSAKTRGDKLRAVQLFFQALAADPSRSAMRPRLANLLLEVGRLDAALEQANLVLGNPEDKADPQTLFVKAAAMHELDRRETREFALTELVAVLREAVEQNRGSREHIELSTRLGNAYRENSQPLYREASDPSDGQQLNKIISQQERDGLADKVIDDMVAADPDHALALFARYRYRKTYDIPGADEDLDRAVSSLDQTADLLPHNKIAVRLDDAARTYQAKQFEDAIESYQGVIDEFPKDRRGYIGLAQCLFVQSGQSQDEAGMKRAVDVLRQGLSEVDKNDFDINALLVRLLLLSKRVEDADTALAALSKAKEAQAIRSPGPVRSRMQAVVDLLQAELYAARGQYHQVPDLLQQVLVRQRSAAEASDTTVLKDDLKCRTYSVLATALGALGHVDRAAEAAEEAARLAPESLRYRLAAGRAWETAGHLDRAINHYRHCGSMAGVDVTARLNFARALLRKQLTMPQHDRNWQQVDDALGKLQEQAGDLFAVRLFTAESAAARGQISEAVQLLQEAEAAKPESPLDWRMLVLMYQQLGELQRADDAIGRYGQLTNNSVDSLLIRAELLVRRGQFERAQQDLTTALKETIPAEEQAPARRFLAQLLLRQRRHDAARTQLEILAESDPPNIWAISLLCSLELDTDNLDRVQHWEDRLREFAGPTDTAWRVVRTHRLVREAEGAEDPRISEAEELQDEIERMRPTWPTTFRLEGEIATQQAEDLKNEYEVLEESDETRLSLEASWKRKLTNAVRAYERAMRLDQSRVSHEWDAARIVQLVYPAGQDASIQPAFDRLPKILAASPRGSAMAIAQSVARGDIPRAVQDAKDAAHARPRDPVAQVWLGYTLWVAKDLEAAETAFLRAKELAPTNTRSWYELLTFYVQNKMVSKAQAALAELGSSSSVAEPQRSLLLAQGYQMVGDRAAAQQHFDGLLDTHDEDVLVLQQAGNFYANADIDRAESALRRALELRPNDRRTARALASLLARRGPDASFEEAGELLTAGPGNSHPEPADQRLHARLLWQHGDKANRGKAAALLEGLVANSGAAASSEDRLRLAQIYEADGRLQLAAQQLGDLANRQTPRPDHLALSAGFLMRHLDASNKEFEEQADAAINRLKRSEPTAVRPLALRARWLQQLGREAEIEPLIESFLKTSLDRAEDDAGRARVLAGVSQVYSIVDRKEVAEKLWRQAVGLDASLKMSLALFLAGMDSEEATAEAMDICIDLAKSDSTPQAAIALSTVLTVGKPSAEKIDVAESVLTEALKEHSQDPNLLLAVGSYWQMKGQSKEAAGLFRKVLELSPSNVSAMNNLAYYLAETGEHQKATQYVRRAIGITGRQSWILDTLGMVHLAGQRTAEAVELFQELAGQLEADPRYEFHLALAYHAAGQSPEARKTLEQARANGLQLHTLTPWDQELLAKLDTLLADVSASGNNL